MVKLADQLIIPATPLSLVRVWSRFDSNWEPLLWQSKHLCVLRSLDVRQTFLFVTTRAACVFRWFKLYLCHRDPIVIALAATLLACLHTVPFLLLLTKEHGWRHNMRLLLVEVRLIIVDLGWWYDESSRELCCLHHHCLIFLVWEGALRTLLL